MSPVVPPVAALPAEMWTQVATFGAWVGRAAKLDRARRAMLQRHAPFWRAALAVFGVVDPAATAMLYAEKAKVLALLPSLAPMFPTVLGRKFPFFCATLFRHTEGVIVSDIDNTMVCKKSGTAVHERSNAVYAASESGALHAVICGQICSVYDTESGELRLQCRARMVAFTGEEPIFLNNGQVHRHGGAPWPRPREVLFVFASPTHVLAVSREQATMCTPDGRVLRVFTEAAGSPGHWVALVGGMAIRHCGERKLWVHDADRMGCYARWLPPGGTCLSWGSWYRTDGVHQHASIHADGRLLVASPRGAAVYRQAECVWAVALRDNTTKPLLVDGGVIYKDDAGDIVRVTL